MPYQLLTFCRESGVVLGSVFRQKVCLLRTHRTIIVYNVIGRSIASISNLADILSSGLIYQL